MISAKQIEPFSEAEAGGLGAGSRRAPAVEPPRARGSGHVALWPGVSWGVGGAVPLFPLWKTGLIKCLGVVSTYSLLFIFIFK